MKTTELMPPPEQLQAQERLEEEVAALAAHINAATARWLELVLEFRAEGGAAIDGVERWLAFRCGISTREAYEYVRVGEALQELPAIRDAFRRGELTFAKLRGLTRVATPGSEERLLELACALTASQLERALRAFRRLRSEEAGEAHALEYLDYHWGEDGSLFLRARLPAEDGTLVVRALEAARDRVRERRRQDRLDDDAGGTEAACAFEPERSLQVEAFVDLAQRALAAPPNESVQRAQLIVHVEAAALSVAGPGRAELEGGPAISPETARRLGCDANGLTVLEQEGLPLSVGRARRTVPPRLRRLLEARDQGCCQWPGCDRRRQLAAHHRTHWAAGGETSLDNLVLLCWHHHRLVHEGGYAIENGPPGELRFRNRYGGFCPSAPRSPPGSVDELIVQNNRLGLAIDGQTNRNGYGQDLELELAVAAVEYAFG